MFEPVSRAAGRFAPAMFLIWLTIASAYMPELAGCQVRRFLGTSMVAKHFIGIVVVYFTIVLLNPNEVGAPESGATLSYNVLVTLGLYVWFVLTTRCDAWVLLLVIALLFGVYKLHQSRSDNEEASAALRRRQVMQGLTLASMLATALGVVLYAMRKREEYGGNFSWYFFFVGRMKCLSLESRSNEVLEEL